MALIVFDGQLFALLGTGMETTWAMALLSLALLLTFRVQNGCEDRHSPMLAALCIAALFATRPDATMLALAAAAGLALFSSQPQSRRAGWTIVLVSLALIGAVVLACWLYYGDALPLAFLAKTLPFSPLPEQDQSVTFDWPSRNFRESLLWHLPEVVLGVVGMAFFRRLSPVMRGAAIGMVVFAAYHLTLVVPVMGYYGRFFAPMLVVLTLLAAGPLEAAIRFSGLAGGWRSLNANGVLVLSGLGLLVAAKIVPIAMVVAASHFADRARDMSLSTSERAIAHAAERLLFYKPHMKALVQALGSDCSIASTEHGILSAYARHTRIIDYSGLHDRRFVLNGFSAERLLNALRPDVLALPPRWYRDWIDAIQSHPAFGRDYVVEPPRAVTASALAFPRTAPAPLVCGRRFMAGAACPGRN